jgi:thymidylate kinase
MLGDPSVSTATRAREIYTHTLYGTRVRLRLRSQRPLLIALDGIDGCGKSAQAALLDRALTGAALRHRVVWTRGGSSALLQPLLRLGKRLLHYGRAGDRAGPRTDTAAHERARAAMFDHPLVRCVWPWLVALELGAAYMVRVRWPLWRGEVVVAERYVLTALIEAAARLDRPGIAGSAPGKLLRLLAPRPGAAYWLDLPPAVALARKGGDESAEFLAAQAGHAPAMAAALRSRRIDATLPLDAVSDRLVTETLRDYEDAHRTVLNALFCANPRPLPAGWRR